MVCFICFICSKLRCIFFNAQTLEFIAGDTNVEIAWSEITSLVSLLGSWGPRGPFTETHRTQQKEILSGVIPDEEDGNILKVPWDSLLGKIIRKNKLAFRLHSVPTDGMILTDISSVGSVLAGVVNRNLNPDLTAEGVLLRVMACSVYPPDSPGGNTRARDT